jgi:hypothetical protein
MEVTPMSEWEQANSIIKQLIEYLKESHASELEDCHAGDVNHTGPAPEDCSYCLAIDQAEQFLAAVEV